MNLRRVHQKKFNNYEMMNLREKAYAFALDKHSLPNYCSGCVKAETALGGADEDGAVVRKLSRCSSCRSVYYCSAECQRADWPLHKAECKCIRRTGSGVGDESLRLVLRIRSKSKRKQQTNNDEPGAVKNGTTPISPFNRTLDDLMMGHIAALTSSKEYQSWASNFRAFARGEAPPGGDAKTNSPAIVIIEETQLKELYAKVCVNAFGLTNEASHKIGLALHMALSAIDNSCAPKARIAYVGDVAVMVPSRKRDTPLSIERAQHSYINEMLGREERRRLLKEKYNFHCCCEACEDERERELSGYACEHCSAGCVDTVGGLCNSCGTRMNQELVDICELNNRIEESQHSPLSPPHRIPHLRSSYSSA